MLLLVTCFSLANLRAQEPQSLISKIAAATSDSQRNAAYIQLINYYKATNIDSAIFYAQQCLNKAVAGKDVLGQAQMMEVLGKIDQGQGRMEIARQRVAYALDLYNEIGDKAGVAGMYNSLGALEATLGNSDAAVRYLIKALTIYDSIKENFEGIMVTNMNLGCVYLQSGDTTAAAKYLFKSEAESKKIPVKDVTISLYNYIGVLYAMEGNLNKALDYFTNDVRISEGPDFVASHVESLLYLSNFYNDLGNVPMAMEYLEKGLAIATEKKLTESRADLLLQLAIMRKKKDPESAMKSLTEALAICENLHSKTLKADIYKEISSVYEQEGKFKEALDATKQQHRISDSLSRINKIKELESLGATYELEKSNNRVKELEVLYAKIAGQRNIIVCISIAIVLALITLAVFYTKTRKLNFILVKREQELEELSNTKNKLFSIIGHDLRAPVARIPIILDIVEDESTSGEERKYLTDSLKEHTVATVETLDKLLYWGQSLMKGTRQKPELFDPKHFIQESIELRKIIAADKEITVIDNTPDNLKVCSDTAHFDFIIRNLLANAIKFTNTHGRIEINADERSKPGYIVFSVKDNGVGIDKDRLKKIFEPFNSKDGTANEKGTGIGLMLCKEFAVKNGGDIWAESEINKGATFFYSVKKNA